VRFGSVMLTGMLGLIANLVGVVATGALAG
jgi:hypothetical protein